MNKKFLKIILWSIGIIITLLIANTVYFKYQVANGELIYYGDRWYTKSQLRKVLPPQYVEVPAKNTPEEVYAEFRQALLDNQIDNALTFVRVENRERVRSSFNNREKLDAWIKMLPEKITKESIDGNFAHYDINMGTDRKNTISFGKDTNGYWKLDI